jgi:hypothetical protein
MAGRGLQFLPLQRVPTQWDPVWFVQFCREVLAFADTRNAIEGAGITITGQPDEAATISASDDIQQLLLQSYVLATPSGFLEHERVLTGSVSIGILDGGDNSAITVDINDYSVNLGKLTPMDMGVLGNPVSGSGPVQNILPDNPLAVLHSDPTNSSLVFDTIDSSYVSDFADAVRRFAPVMRGEDGDDGMTIPGTNGLAGAPGPQGAAGVGAPGPEGDAGDDGYPIPGPAGPASTVPGPAGAIGLSIPGMDGESGEDGYPIPGTPGATGAASTVPGPAGLIVPGRDGEDGQDVYFVPGSAGAPGGIGAAGLDGLSVRGQDGEDGQDGIPIPGAAGAAGSAGAAGIAGLTIPGRDGDDAEATFFMGAPGINFDAPVLHAYAPGGFSIPDGHFAIMAKRLQLTTTQRVTLQGTARLRIT